MPGSLVAAVDAATAVDAAETDEGRNEIEAVGVVDRGS